ncbi:MAG: hypothetical protein DYG98_13585 [Haliscomenobacteraceae bacterium CHB4]|nr:hypothetical protein [Saprospiraceae bacterium]MCE7924080.1 hypothetical protein [Haliscomenobacteraceae bacterium CHB4]
MKNNLLLSHRWKTPGWILTVPAFLTGLYLLFIEEDFEQLCIQIPAGARHFLWIKEFTIGQSTGDQPITLCLLDELVSVCLLVGLLLLAFSREKVEDEWIRQVRLESLQWAILINSLLLILFTVFTYGSPFFTVMTFNMFTPLLIFVGRFYYILRLKPLFSKN